MKNSLQFKIVLHNALTNRCSLRRRHYLHTQHGTETAGYFHVAHLLLCLSCKTKKTKGETS
jgi:hypothetical protein